MTFRKQQPAATQRLGYPGLESSRAVEGLSINKNLGSALLSTGVGDRQTRLNITRPEISPKTDTIRRRPLGGHRRVRTSS
jgi:hypothetical protein